MTGSTEDEKLDQLLLQFAETSVSDERLRKLRDRIVASATHDASPIASDSGDTTESGQQNLETIAFRNDIHRHDHQPRWSAKFVVGTVLTMLTLLAIGLSEWSRKPPKVSAEVPPDYVWLRKEQIKSKKLLLSEMKRLFNDRLAWVVESGDQLELSVDESAVNEQDVSSVEHFAVRLVVEHRNTSNDEWQVAWEVDVITRQEEFIHIPAGKVSNQELTIWTCRLSDGAIAVDSQLRMLGMNSALVESLELHLSENPVVVTTAEKNKTEYRVFQSVATLDDGVI